MFGKNIKKIRSVKGLSQQAFADLFGLKRGTLAAYEEGRSNPRVETVIKIAAHFNLDTDELLKSDLTVNRLLQFNDSITTNAQLLPVQQFATIPCLVESLESEFVRLHGEGPVLKRLPVLQLPLTESRNYLGYTVHTPEMVKPGGSGFLPKDVVIGKKIQTEALLGLKAGTYLLILTQTGLIFRKGAISDNKLVLSAETEGLDPMLLPITEIVSAWEIVHVFHRKLPAYADALEQRLKMLEREFEAIKSSGIQ